MTAADRIVPAGHLAPAVWAGFAMMCVGMFMAILDIQVVATSLPAIQSALAIRPDEMSWIQTAYLIAEVIAIPLTGFLTRVMTMRWLFVAAVGVFTLASAGCAGASGFGALVSWRVLQGFAGGTLIPAVFSAVFLLFPERLQGVATTLAGVVAVLAPTLGPVVGGWITQTYPGRRRRRRRNRAAARPRRGAGRGARRRDARLPRTLGREGGLRRCGRRGLGDDSRPRRARPPRRPLRATGARGAAV